MRVWVGKDAQGRGTASYAIGEAIRVGVQVTQDAYVYLFDVNSVGEISLFVPNGYDGAQGNFVQAGQRTVFPGQGAQYTLTVGGPRGQDRILALASRAPLDLSATSPALPDRRASAQSRCRAKRSSARCCRGP